MEIEGGPEDQTSNEEPDTVESTVEEVTINGKKYSVDKEMAAELKREQESSKARREEVERELQESRSNRQAPQPAAQEEDDSDLVFRDPAKFKENVKAEIRAEYQQEQTRKSSQEEFWKGFYRVNNDLKIDDKWVAEKVIADQYDELASSGMSNAKIYERVGEMTRERILSLSGKGKGEPTNKARPVEGGSANPPKDEGVEAKPKVDGVRSISDVLKERKKARVAAVTGRKSA